MPYQFVSEVLIEGHIGRIFSSERYTLGPSLPTYVRHGARKELE